MNRGRKKEEKINENHISQIRKLNIYIENKHLRINQQKSRMTNKA